MKTPLNKTLAPIKILKMSRCSNNLDHSAKGINENELCSRSGKKSKKSHSTSKDHENASTSESDSNSETEYSISTSSDHSSNNSTMKRPPNNKRRKYNCRKCKEHGREVSVRMHKKRCPYQNCKCDACKLVDYGRIIEAQQIAFYRCVI